MPIKGWRLKVLFLPFMGLILAACSAPAIKTTALVPARFHEATKIRQIAVLPFDGPYGKEFAAEIEGVLSNINIDDKKFFTVIDRTRLGKVLREQELSQTGAVDEKWAVKVGRLVGAKGIYTGVITAANSRDNQYTENRSVCLEKEKTYDKKGNVYEGECLRWRHYSVSCTKRDAIFSITPKLIEVETGKIIYSNNLSQLQSVKGCPDSGSPLPSGLELLGRAKEIVKGALKRDIAPFYVTFEIQLMDSEDGIGSQAGIEKLKQGLEYASKNRFDRSCELWGEGRILSPNAPAILYNLGVCAEVRGDLVNALDLLRKADRALNRPDDRITAGIGRVSEAIKKQQKLQEQLK